MKLLAIDTSGLVAAVALVQDGKLLAEYRTQDKKTHSQTLMPMLDAMRTALDLDMGTLDAIGVAAGPGSFTGLRIGAATAKGLAFALGIPVVPVSTLDALAWQLLGETGVICPLMDARRGQVYTGLYRFIEDSNIPEPAMDAIHEEAILTDRNSSAQSRTGLRSAPVGAERTSTGRPAPPELCSGADIETLVAPCAVPVGEILQRINEIGEPSVFLGDGVPVFAETIADECRVPYRFAPSWKNRQSAAALGDLCIRRALQGGTVPAEDFAPEYLRPSQAEREAAGAKEKEADGLLIGRMTAADAEEAAILEAACLGQEAWNATMLGEAAERRDCLYVAAYLGGRQIGHAGIRAVLGEGEITNVCVDADHRGRGIGYRLMQALLEGCPKLGIGDCTLEVRASNRAAIALYEKAGFKTEGIRPGFYENPADDAAIMWRRG